MSSFLASIVGAAINTMTYAADRLAYDAAVFVASGGDGDDPLFDNRSVGEYFYDYGLSVAADALGQIDEAGLFGNFSLCDPDGTVTLAFKLGVKAAFQRPEPSCDIKDVTENWDGFLAKVSSTLDSPFEKNSMILTELADIYNPKSNDFSVGILLTSSIMTKAQQDAALAAQRKLFGGFFKDKTDFITGRVETPAEMIQAEMQKMSDYPQELRNAIAITSISDPDILKQVFVHAGSVFTNTLLSQVTQKLYDGLFNDLDQTDIDPFDIDSFSLGSSEDAKESYRSFLTASLLSVSNYSLLGEFGSCPSEGRGLYNCVADSPFISGIVRANGGIPLTVAEAIEEGVLHREWPLIPPSDQTRNQDPYCYTYGYCYGNLVKLREARVLSIGWELAAELSTDAHIVTLGEVVDGYYSCNAQNERNDAFPFCHLIDPNWILKYPETQCRNEAYGQMLTTSASDERKTECVDMPTCIDEDADGNCTGGYGYCVREENIWDFRGESCPEYYGSCTTYQNPNGEEFNFLSETTDSGPCVADSAGCLWYGTQKTENDSGVFDWPDYSTSTLLAAAESVDDIYRNRIYFTSAVEECTSDDAGCRELVSRVDGTTFNMLSNPSFEIDGDVNGLPDGWFTSGAVDSYSTDATKLLDGSDAVNPGFGSYYQTGIVMTQAAEYTLSFYVRQNDSVVREGANVLFTLTASNGEFVDFRGYGLSGNCTVSSRGNNILELTGTPDSTIHQRYSCTFTVPTLSSASIEALARIDIAGGNMWFDAVQLEQEPTASDFHEGYSSGTLDLAYVKVPPTYLGCTGEADQPTECENYAQVCSQVDVGCSLYSPTNGDPSVSGIAGSLDACPAECVGYDTFKQEPTRYEPDGDFPVYFIPDSAETCSAQYIGCDEFTDISTEEASYFTFIRACVTSDQADANVSSDNAAVFYTWEGSDTAGYQLKTWRLLESDMGNAAYTYAYSSPASVDSAPGAAPCTSWVTTASGIACDDDGSDADSYFDADSANCDEHADTIINPDCREFYDTDGNIHYRNWTDTVTVNDACVTYRKTDIVGIGEDNDLDDIDDGEENCESSGGWFDSTTATCRYYGYADESFSCPAEESGCREYTGGRSRNSRQAFVEYFEDGDLTNWDANSASSVTLSNESIATDGHSLYSDGQPIWTYVGGNGTVCAVDDGCETTAGVLGGVCALANGEAYCGTLSDATFAGKTYTVSFWAKGSGTLSVGFDTDRSTGTPSIDAAFATGVSEVMLESGWRQYSFGPINMDEATYPSFGSDTTTLVFAPGSGTTFYVDNVVLREGEDNIDVIKDSWVTPATCDQTEGGTISPQYMLGCQEYTDQNSDTSYLKSFSSLCDESKVGCSSYFMTQESDSTGGAVYGASCSMLSGAVATAATSCYYAQVSGAYDTTSPFLCTIGIGELSCTFDLDWYAPPSELPSHISYTASTAIAPADKDVFLVVNNDVECSSDVAGCMEVGLPVFSQDHTAVSSWTTTYLMNTPDDYGSTLCSAGELFCQAWTDNNGTTDYFRDPQDQTCEYRTNVTVNNVTYNGWFKTGTEEICDSDYVIGGTSSGIWRNGDDAYSGWVGTCLAKYDSCSNFQDLVDLSSDEIYTEADGTSYYFLNNDSLEENSLPDSQKCNNKVGQTEGCGLFNDTSDPAKTSNASATYVASMHADALFGAQQNDLVSPVDCDSDSVITTPTGETVDLCANRCWYAADSVYDINGSGRLYVFDGSCYENADCRPLTSESGAIVNGSCRASRGAVTAPRLENDSNIVLKVNRDRECSEWLTCADSQTAWDERTNSYVDICSDIALCSEYSGTNNASFCSDWVDDAPAAVLTIDEYANRDVSWYGNDYSGYAIPNLLPVDQLTQVNIASPLACETTDLGTVLESYDGISCIDDADCGGTAGENEYCISNSNPDYRLGYIAGSCESSDYGESCTVGYCSRTGSACTSTGACGTDGGSCVIGTCYDPSSAVCASDADCADTQVCLGTYCATDNGSALIDSYSPVDPDASACLGRGEFYASVNFKQGTCMYNQCILAPNGSTFNETNSEVQDCRAYPEANSPFGNEIVKQWQDPSEGLPIQTAEPLTLVQNFENVQTCSQGEDCNCSYQKVTYEEGGLVKYYGIETEFDFAESGLCTSGMRGDICSSDEECDSVEDMGDGVCQVVPDQIDNVLGISGYCLEHDSSMNILGDRDRNACLTWFPIDQLAGATDLYAKYTSAGYFEETNYCSYLGSYASVQTATGCIEKEKDGGRDDITTFEQCMHSASACPMGSIMVAGPFDGGGIDHGTFAGYSAPFDLCSAGGDDCPFLCVPIHSFNSADESCAEVIQEFVTGMTMSWMTDDDSPREYHLDRLWISGGADFEEAYRRLYSCTTQGVEIAALNGSFAWTAGGNPFWQNSWGFMPTDFIVPMAYTEDSWGWYNYNGYERYTPYLACKEMTQVATGEETDNSAPWTDLILNPNKATTSYSLSALGGVSSAYPENAYISTSSNFPFGAAQDIAEIEDDDASPSIVPQCSRAIEFDSADDLETYGGYWEGFQLIDAGGVAGESDDSGLVCDAGTGSSIGDLNAAEAGGFWSFRTRFWSLGSYYDTYSTTDHSLDSIINVGVGGTGIDVILDGVFARSLGTLRFEDGIMENAISMRKDPGDGWINRTPDVPLSESWDSRADYGNPPSIRGLDLDNCYEGRCEEDSGHPLTLNEQNDGDVEADSFYRAYLKFYAAADKNQLPLRRVIVDWGDGEQSGSDSDNNFYKNHRGLEDGKETSICEILPDDLVNYEWGMNSDSCDPNYFNYSHIYTCNPSLMPNVCADTDGDGIYDNTPCTNDGNQCVFRPRVHVRDNWGWCTGTCAIGNPADEDGNGGCFTGVDYELDAINDSRSECAYGMYPEEAPALGIDPWVYYDGVITVTPQ